MRIFVAGITGIVGRCLAPRLIEAGHKVVGMMRSASKIGAVRAMGADPVVADALDRNAAREAVAQAQPDVILHQLTAIPHSVNPKNLEADFALTNRLRSEGTDNLLEAARECGVRRFLAQGFGGYRWYDSAAIPAAAAPLTAALEYLERAVPAAGGLVLRYGAFYGPGTAIGGGGGTVEAIRKRQFPLVGAGTGEWSFVHIDDVVRATVQALDRGDAGIYNIADDEPAPVAEWLPALAEAVGAKPPRHVPTWLAKWVAGETSVALMTSVRGIDNREAKRVLDWEPTWPTWREGFRHAL